MFSTMKDCKAIKNMTMYEDLEKNKKTKTKKARKRKKKNRENSNRSTPQRNRVSSQPTEARK